MKKLAMICLAAALCFLSLSVYSGKINLGTKVQAGECAKWVGDYCSVWA